MHRQVNRIKLNKKQCKIILGKRYHSRLDLNPRLQSNQARIGFEGYSSILQIGFELDFGIWIRFVSIPTDHWRIKKVINNLVIHQKLPSKISVLLPLLIKVPLCPNFHFLYCSVESGYVNELELYNSTWLVLFQFINIVYRTILEVGVKSHILSHIVLDLMWKYKQAHLI